MLVLMNLTSKVISVYFRIRKTHLNVVDNSKGKALPVCIVSPSPQRLKRNYLSTFMNFLRAFSLCNFPFVSETQFLIGAMLSLQRSDRRSRSACWLRWRLVTMFGSFFLVETCFSLFLRQFSAQLLPALHDRNAWLAPPDTLVKLLILQHRSSDVWLFQELQS